MNGYELSRLFWDWAFENPEKVSPNHAAIYFFAVEHCNRLGWKDKFGFPTQMVMDAVGIKKHDTYIRYFNDLVNFGFFKLIQKSKNQYSSNIICLGNAFPKNGKALGKAILNHAEKQTDTMGESIGESNRSINKHINHKPQTIKNDEFEKNEKQESLEVKEITVEESDALFEKQGLRDVPFKAKIMKGNTLNEEQYQKALDDWKIFNDETKFNDEKHLKNSFHHYVIKNLDFLQNYFPPKVYSKSTLKDNWW